MNSNCYHFEGRASFEIQVAKATNGQKNGSAEESIVICFRSPEIRDVRTQSTRMGLLRFRHVQRRHAKFQPTTNY